MLFTIAASPHDNLGASESSGSAVVLQSPVPPAPLVGAGRRQYSDVIPLLRCFTVHTSAGTGFET